MSDESDNTPYSFVCILLLGAGAASVWAWRRGRKNTFDAFSVDSVRRELDRTRREFVENGPDKYPDLTPEQNKELRQLLAYAGDVTPSGSKGFMDALVSIEREAREDLRKRRKRSR